jgi:manganese transport protein
VTAVRPIRPLPDEQETNAQTRGEAAGLRVLEGKDDRGKIMSILPFLGPAFVASVAYVDPGNFATNISAGAQFGYRLLWVVVAANLVAMLVQHLSSKLGIATGKNLPQTMRVHWPRPVVIGIWITAEIAAMATDLAEFLGAAIGFNLLFHMPLLLGGLLTGAVTIAILGMQRFGFRPIEAVVGSLVGVIALCYLAETFVDRPAWNQVAYHSVTPFVSSASLLVSVGILGATVMPHVVYLHSALTQSRIRARTDEQKRRLMRFNLIDVVIAMAIAGMVNMAMLYMAASTFHKFGFTNVTDIGVAYRTLTPLLGSAASIIFGISLLASGVASSAVGTMAGQVIMDGFLGWTVPIWVRRGVTMVPALIVIAVGLPTTMTLVVSQVVLSLALPFAIAPLVWFTANRRIMGVLTNHPTTTMLAALCAVLVVALNMVLIVRSALG